MQWKHASLGRKVSGDVVDFLKMHGATVSGGKIVGGPVSVPMEVNEAVVSTVDTILKDISSRATRSRKPPPARTSDDSLPPTAEQAPHPVSRMSPTNARAVHKPTGQAQQGPPQFPEPPISGKTGKVLSTEATLEGGSVSRGAYPSESGGDGEDFSYAPPMPPGMAPPTQMP